MWFWMIVNIFIDVSSETLFLLSLAYLAHDPRQPFIIRDLLKFFFSKTYTRTDSYGNIWTANNREYQNCCIVCVMANIPAWNRSCREIRFAKSPNITTGIWEIDYLIPQRFSWLKNYKLYWYSLLPDNFFDNAKTMKAFDDTDLMLTMEMVDKSNLRT